MGKKKAVPPEIKAAVQKAYETSDLTMAAIAEKYGLTVSWIGYNAKKEAWTGRRKKTDKNDSDNGRSVERLREIRSV